VDWFRLYHNLPDTGPWLDLKDTHRAIYIEILCLASRRGGDDRGTICTVKLHRKLRRHSGQVLAAVSALTSASLLVDIGSEPGVTFECAGWDSFQYDSDNSTVRSRKHRESKKTASKCNVAATSPERPAKRSCNALEKRRTDTEESREEHTKTRVCAREDVTAVIQFWKQSWNKPDYRDNMAEQITVSNALRQGWTVDQLKDCIAGYRNDKWPKRKQYSGLTYLLKDGDAIQGGIDLVETKAPETPDGGYEAWAEKMKDEAIAGDGEIDWDAPPWSRSRWESESVGREG